MTLDPFAEETEDKLVPGNFKDNKVQKTTTEDLVSKGFFIGAKVDVKKRFTVKYGKKENDRKDMVVGMQASVYAFADDGIVCRFEFEDKAGKTQIVDWKCKEESIGPVVNTCGVAKQAPTTAAIFKKYPFLLPAFDAASTGVEALDKWESNLMKHDERCAAEVCKRKAGFFLSVLNHCVDEQDSEGLLILRTSADDSQVWTLKDFKPDTLTFIPDTTEMKTQ